jgi:hypothetical protein
MPSALQTGMEMVLYHGCVACFLRDVNVDLGS